jgi:flavin reductase (DIM6/NTAB) family NADH-FMN oxidoreductase RutF
VSEPFSNEAFREALAHFASGLTIVATTTTTGPVGFTASAFSSVSLAPPLVLVCVGKRASAHDAVTLTELFGVSVLAEWQSRIAEQFGRSGTDRFRDVPLRSGARVPLIDGALVQLECRRYATHDAGDHTILVGEVLDGRVSGGAPLVHFGRKLGRFVASGGES